jgi:hypothetical protein
MICNVGSHMGVQDNAGSEEGRLRSRGALSFLSRYLPPSVPMALLFSHL